MRTAVLAVALLFIVGLAFLTVYAAVDRGFTVLSVVSLLVVGLLGVGILGALWPASRDDDPRSRG